MKKLLLFLILIFCTQNAFAFDGFGILSEVVQSTTGLQINKPQKRGFDAIEGVMFATPDPKINYVYPPKNKDYMLVGLPVKPTKYNFQQACTYNDKLMAKLQENYRKKNAGPEKIGKNSDGSTYVYGNYDTSESWRINDEYYSRYINTTAEFSHY